MSEKILNSFDTWIKAQGLKSKGRNKSIDNISLEGIGQLRKLILTLALNGKLSYQDSRETVLGFENIDSLENNITPSNWKTLKVESCFDIKSGATFNRSKELDEGDYLYLKVADLGLQENEKEIKTSSRYINPDEKEIRALIPAGSIIFPKRGGAIATNKKRITNKDLFVDLNIMTIFPHKGILLGFAYLWINSFDLAELNTGTSVPQINHKDIEPLVFPIPPLEEQKRIVAKVDELMALCDELERQEKDHLRMHHLLVETLLTPLTNSADEKEFSASWSRLANHFEEIFTTEESIDQLKQTILQLAVMGKLVPQDPNDEPASELLKKIAKEKDQLIKEGKLKKSKPLPEIAEDEKPFELPKGWEWVRLINICEVITKGSSPKWQGVQYVDEQTGILFITSENVGSYKLELDKSKYVEQKFNEIEPRSILKRGDYLMNIVGASIGRTAFYDSDEVANINQAVCLIRPMSEFSHSLFLLHFFNSELCLSYMFDKQVDNARANLSMGNISKFIIPIPPSEEQARIVSKIDKLYQICDSLKERVKQSQQISNDMAFSVLDFVDE